jgi:RND family efflux transporter MFP subunit
MNRIRLAIIVLVVAGLGFIAYNQFSSGNGQAQEDRKAGPAAVEVRPIEQGPIELRRTFSGTLESPAAFNVAPKISGRVAKLAVNVADPVTRNQVVAVLDDDEYVQAVAQAEAELALAKANLTEARNSLQIAERELERMLSIHKQGIASDAQLDTAKANQLTKEAAVSVAEAQISRAEATLATARVRLDYTTVNAAWSGGDDQRVVAERFVNEGDTVAQNTSLLSVVELDPIRVVVFVTEKDYALMKTDQAVQVTTDAFPKEVFQGKIIRIAPIFRQESRQARVEISASNPNHHLKPGMFVRAMVVLDKLPQATIVPVAALTTRDGKTGVFVVNEKEKTVSWRPVQEGIRQDDRVQVVGLDISGRVVILGQQLIDEGSPISISENQSMGRELSP